MKGPSPSKNGGGGNPLIENILPEDGELTIGTIRKMLPSHLFERSALKSMRYVIQDAIAVAACIYLSNRLINEETIPYVTVRALLWLLTWWIQGAFMTGLWVMAHECGHQAFSASRLINDAVGCILHSMLLVPYWTWAHSHKLHHSNANSMERDTVFVPVTKRDEWTSLLWRPFGILRMYEKWKFLKNTLVFGFFFCFG